MRKISVDELIFEITRKCNMSCPHCLRGDAQDRDITKEAIDHALDQIEDVYSISFTGGEPSLNPDAMMYVLEACKKRKIKVYSFFLATNGKEVSDAFIDAVNAWYRYYMHCTWDYDVPSGDQIVSGDELVRLVGYLERDWENASDGFVIALSADKYHEGIPYRNAIRLMGLPGFSSMKATDFNRYAVINDGRARLLGNGQEKRNPDKIDFCLMENGRGYQANTLYVNVEGLVLPDCNMSYVRQEGAAYSVFDPDWVESLIREYAAEDVDADHASVT